MLKKLLSLTAIALMALGFTASVAGAQPYPPAANSITIDDSSTAPGQKVTLVAKTFAPGATVTFTLFSAPVVLGTATADASGVATLVATIPAGAAVGTHTVEASGNNAAGAPLVVSLTLTVAAAAAAPLPTTGSNSTLPLAQLGLGVLAVGGLLVLVAKRRRNEHAEPAGA
jgi:LPXTG-motif cell wall-anchored protein